jgi:hypothetical protein
VSISRRQYRLWAALSTIVVMLFLTPGALADLPNQTEIDNALEELTAAETAARANIPGNSRVKEAEDALDAAKRANEDTPADDATAKANAEAAEAAAQATVDALRRDMKDRTSDVQQERAKKYREALNKRRAARKRLQAVLAELKDWLGNRRGNIGGTKELEDAINLLRPRIGQSQMPIAPQSTAALMPFGSMVANVAADAQAYCTFGGGASTPIAFVPSDQDGNPLRMIGKTLASRPLMGPGGVKVPANAGNPETPPKSDKPQGETTSTPQTAPQGQGPSTLTPAAGPSAPKAGTSVPQPENPTAQTGSDDLGRFAEVLSGKDATPPKAMSEAPAPTASSGTPAAGSDSILDEITEVINMGAGGELTLDERLAREFENWIKSRKFIPGTLTPDPRGLTPMEKLALYHQYLRGLQRSTSERVDPEKSPDPAPQSGTTPPAIGPLPAGSSAGVHSKGSGEYAPSPGASLEPLPDTGSGPQLNPEVLKPAWERRDAFPTPPDAGNDVQKSVGEKSALIEKPASGVQSSLQSMTIDKSAQKEPISKASATGDIALHFKATESVMQAGTHGAEIKTLFVKLVPTATPEEPKAGRTKTAKAALDEGHDQGVVGCVVQNGQCKALLAAADAKAYGLERAGPNLRADLSLRNNTGGVLHKTASGGGSTTPNESLLDAPGGALIKKSDFKIGKETFTRVSVAAAGTIAADLLAKFSKDFGPKFEIDHCGEKKPGPPLGMEPVSYSALNSELPQATITLQGPVRLGANPR